MSLSLAAVFSLVVASFAASANAQTAEPKPGLSAQSAELPWTPVPQTPTQQARQKPDQPTAPWLQDFGISPAQAKADLDAQHRLDRGTNDLKMHQTLGLITLAPITAASLSSGLVPPDSRRGNKEVGRDLQIALANASVTLHAATVWEAIKGPDMPGHGPTEDGIRLLRMQANTKGAEQSPASAPQSTSGGVVHSNGAGDNGQAAQPAGTAQVAGVVSDTQGNAVSGAEVTLTSPGKLGRKRTTTAATDGSFSFTGLPAGMFRLLATAPGFGAYISSELSVKSGEAIEAPKIALNVTTASSVDVFATTDQIAEAQLEEQQRQRVFGVFQNFYTSYIWQAEPMSPKQKYRLAFRTIVDPTTFVVLAGVAGSEQYNGTYPGYGPGITGYGKRYGAALADSVSGRIIGSAVLASAFHQDPRYFYQGSGGIRSRTWHALSSAVLTRADNGKLQPNYSHLLGSLAAGGLANAYHPESSRGLGLTFQTLGVTTGANAIGNLFREFVLRSLEPSVPGFANGKKAESFAPSHP